MKKYYTLAIFLAANSLLNAQEVVQNNEVGKTILNSQQAATSSILERTVVDDTLWMQTRSQEQQVNSITSSYYNGAGWGMYVADDFEFIQASTVNSIFFDGSQFDADGASYINGIDIYFYKDDNGIPAGNPSEVGSEFYKVSGIPIDSEYVTVEPGIDPFLGNKKYFIDLEGFLGEGIELPADHYWISIVFDLDLDNNDFDIRWMWTDSTDEHLNLPVYIAPSPQSSPYYPEWTTIQEVGFPVTAMAFQLFGEEGALGTNINEQEQLLLFPNPANDYITVAGISEEVQHAYAISILGQRHKLDVQGKTVDVSHLANGLYIMEISTSEGVFSKRILKN